jgi:hypothetical protein
LEDRTLLFTGSLDSHLQISQQLDWEWSSDSDLYVGNYTHVKVMGYIDSSSEIQCFNISTTNGNRFSEEYGTYYYNLITYDNRIFEVKFFNNGERLEFNSGINSIGNDDYYTLNVLGYYHWG